MHPYRAAHGTPRSNVRYPTIGLACMWVASVALLWSPTLSGLALVFVVGIPFIAHHARVLASSSE